MKIKALVGAAVTALLAGGLAVIGVAAPASAHTPSASADCSVLTVNASYYETNPGTSGSTKWWNFEPNKDQGPLDSAPSFPMNARGTWGGPKAQWWTRAGPDRCLLCERAGQLLVVLSREHRWYSR